MKIIFPEILQSFDIQEEYVNEVIVENQNLLKTILNDLVNQIQGTEGKTVLSKNDIPIPISKNVELLDRFIPFELNRKMLVNKISNELEKQAQEADKSAETFELLTNLERYLDELAFSLNCDVSFDTINISSILKASGIHLNEDYDSLAEKAIDYFELVREFDRDRLFILFNIRCFLPDDEAEKFVETILQHRFFVILLETYEHPRLNGTKRYIIDKDLCEIG